MKDVSLSLFEIVTTLDLIRGNLGHLKVHSEAREYVLGTYDCWLLKLQEKVRSEPAVKQRLYDSYREWREQYEASIKED